MPPVILLALGAVGVMLVVRWIGREARRMNAGLRADHEGPGEFGRVKVHKLERDPETGIYRPKQ